MPRKTAAATAPEALEQEYEHMQTGYFHRRPAAKDEAEKPQ